jgi:hypothetical protein
VLGQKQEQAEVQRRRRQSARHESYRVLCAIAADGGLDNKNEKQELRTHLNNCRECRQLFRDFCFITELIRKAILYQRWEELRRKCGLPDLSASPRKARC